MYFDQMSFSYLITQYQAKQIRLLVYIYNKEV